MQKGRTLTAPLRANTRTEAKVSCSPARRVRHSAAMPSDERCWKMRASEQIEVALFSLAYFAMGVLLLASENARPLGGLLCLSAPVAFFILTRRPRFCLVPDGLEVRNVRNTILIPKDAVMYVSDSQSGRVGGHLKIEVRGRGTVNVTAVRDGLLDIFRRYPTRIVLVARAVREHVAVPDSDADPQR